MSIPRGSLFQHPARRQLGNVASGANRNFGSVRTVSRRSGAAISTPVAWHPRLRLQPCRMGTSSSTIRFFSGSSQVLSCSLRMNRRQRIWRCRLARRAPARGRGGRSRWYAFPVDRATDALRRLGAFAKHTACVRRHSLKRATETCSCWIRPIASRLTWL